MFRLLKHHWPALVTALLLALANPGLVVLMLWVLSALIVITLSALPSLILIALISALLSIVNLFHKEMTAMPGYATRVTTLRFDEFAEEGDQVFVVIRNPKLVPPGELVPKDIQLDANGNPVDMEAVKTANNDLIAKLVIGWRVYDASDLKIDDNGDPLPQQPLPLPATGELVAKLPSVIYMRLIKEISDAVNPPQDPATDTSKMS